MTHSPLYDITVIGGGPGGYVAAIRAAQLGLKVALVERKHLGGICLNWGCIPTKSLLRSSEVLSLIRQADDFGISVENVSHDLPAIIKRSRKIAGQLNNGIGHLLKKNKVDVMMGEARLSGFGQISILKDDGEVTALSTRHTIIATGARPRQLPHINTNKDHIWTYMDALNPTEMPKRLLVIGSGAIGLEFADFYATLGTDVNIVEMADRMLPGEDKEISAHMAKAFKKRGISVKTRTTVAAIEKTHNGIVAQIEQNGSVESLSYDKILLAIGVVGNTEGLGLEALGVSIENGHITTDENGRTTANTIWAIGDVAGAPCLAHKASHEGVAVAEMIAGIASGQPKPAIPGCIYTHPQVSSIGLSEQAAIDAGHTIAIGRFPLMGNGKALALGDSDGFIKTIFDKSTDKLLGAHMVGPEVTELIQGFAIALSFGATSKQLSHVIFPHPTLSEAMHESILSAADKALHI